MHAMQPGFVRRRRAGLVTAGQSCFGVWGHLARSGVIWRGWHLIWHLLSGPPGPPGHRRVWLSGNRFRDSFPGSRRAAPGHPSYPASRTGHGGGSRSFVAIPAGGSPAGRTSSPAGVSYAALPKTRRGCWPPAVAASPARTPPLSGAIGPTAPPCQHLSPARRTPDIDSKTTHAPAADPRTASANSPPAINHPATGPDVGAVVLNLFFTHSRIKQHLNDEREAD
jgi:hypothetical protein